MNLIKLMLQFDPAVRISMKKVLRHPWMQLPTGKIQMFNQPELKKIKQQSQPCLGSDEPQRLLTEIDISLKQESTRQKPSAAVSLEGTQVWQEGS